MRSENGRRVHKKIAETKNYSLKSNGGNSNPLVFEKKPKAQPFDALTIQRILRKVF
jgi:hypothetical protein